MKKFEEYKSKIEKNENYIQDLKEIIEKMKAKNDNKYYNSFDGKRVNKSFYNNNYILLNYGHNLYYFDKMPKGLLSLLIIIINYLY